MHCFNAEFPGTFYVALIIIQKQRFRWKELTLMLTLVQKFPHRVFVSSCDGNNTRDGKSNPTKYDGLRVEARCC